MRFNIVRSLLLVAVFTGTARAEHPYVGIWKINVAESQYPPGAAPKEQTAVITEVGTELDHKITGVAADGHNISARIVIPETSGPGRVLQGPNYDAVSVKWFSPQEREITYTNQGKIVNTVHSSISDDGKHMFTDSHGVNARGERTEGHAVYDREESSESIAGRWRSLETSKGGIGALFEFRDGGVVVFSPGAVVEMPYRVERGELVLPPATHTGPEQRIRITITDKDQLGLEPPGAGPVRIELRRVGTKRESDDPLVGEWLGERDFGGHVVEARYIFYGNRKCLLLIPFTRTEGTWSATATTITLNFPGQSTVEGQYAIEGDTLTIPGPHGTGKSTFRRY